MDNDLQRRRDENLERNRLFFENLLGKPELSSQNIVSNTENEMVESNSSQTQFKISLYLQKIEESCDSQHFNALQKYPERKKQLNILFGYLRNNLKCGPVLICIGESGSSKSEIIRAAFCGTEEFTFPWCKVSCCGYSNSQQLIRGIWFEFRTAVRNKCIELFGPGGNLRLGNDTERPSKFAHLCASMNKLMVAAFGVDEKEEESKQRHVCFHLVLERVDALGGAQDGEDSYTQHSLLSKLLQFSVHAHPHIKVVATSRSAVWGANLPGALTVSFPPLEESAARAVLLRRMDGLVAATLGEELGVGEGDRQVVTQAMSARMSKIFTDGFTNLRVVSKHLPTVWRLLESVWSKLFSCSMVETVRNLLVAIRTHQSLDDRLSGSFQDAVKSAVNHALSLPAFGAPLDEGPAERVSVGRFSTDWRRNPGWCEQLSRRVLYVLVACFIASNNPAESDLMKLTEAQSGRRKRQRLGADSSEGATSSSSSAVSLSSLSGRSALPSRCFSLERLHGIFCLMVTAGQGGSATDSMFGDSGLNSTIRDLVEQRVLDAAPSWTITSPQYTSNVSYITALDASRSVGLRLGDYLMGNDSAYPL